MLEDILEESWTYKEIARKGMQMRFPELVSLAKQRTAPIYDPEVLHNLIVQLFGVQTVDEARQALMEAGLQK